MMTPEREAEIRQKLELTDHSYVRWADRDVRDLLAELDRVRAERDELRRGCNEWNEKFEQWRSEVGDRAERAEAALREALGCFGDLNIWRELTPKDAEHVRSVPLMTAPKVADLYRWHAALRRQTERACRFNCDADGSGCTCAAHVEYHAALAGTAPAPFREYEQIAANMCRKAGCKCPRPLLGWTEWNTPRCRLCNTDVAPARPAYETLRRRIHDAMRAVCGGCNHGVEMDCYNKHRGGQDCEAVRYRDVLAMMDYSHVENPAPAPDREEER